MKHFLPAVLMLFTISVFATDTETILPKTKVIRPLSWYSEQSIGWKEKVEKNSSDGSSWLNYYSASRYAQVSLVELNNIALKAELAIPGTFEAKVIKALNNGYSKDSFELLMVAYKMNPESPATYAALTLYGEINQSANSRLEFGKKLLNSGQVSQALLSYSYNVLMSVESGSTLFVEGDNTTIPLFILQDIMGVRKDVTILNLELLVSKNYRDTKLAAVGLKSPLFEDKSEVDKRLFCSIIPEQNPEKKFYYALTMGRDNISAINNQLYVVGLASQLSTARLDNISVIKENLEKRFLMDYLLVDFNGESEYSAGRVLSSNYLVSMLLLNDHYLKTGEGAKAKQLEKVFTKIANETGKTELVDNFLGREKDDFVTFKLIDIEEPPLKLVKGNLYAGEYEVTNQQYNLYLDYLSKNGPADLYEKSRVSLAQYSDPTALAFFKGYHTYIYPVVKIRGKNNYHYKNYPIVNITHEGALAYCEWLTQQYNGSTNKKFKKVKFRLPTLKEWQIAALGFPGFQSWDLEKNVLKVSMPKNNQDELSKEKPTDVPFDDTFLYPWWSSHNYRNKAQNRRNCFLGNFKAPDDCQPCVTSMIGKDGWSMMGSAGSYFPNDMGLYDVVGNVAEMIDEDGKACGGSWNHSPEESTIKSVSTYTGPDATVGFRIFMEVIEK